MSLRRLPTSPASVAVVGGDAIRRRQILMLLGDAGFAATHVEAAPTMFVLIAANSDADRVRAIRGLLEADTNALILIVMPAAASHASLRRSMVAGAAGIVFDSDLPRALVPTARAMLAGQLAVPSALGQMIAPRPLSHREKEILSLVVLGLTNREIARRLYLAESTVKTHLSSAFRKIDARSRAEAVARIQDPESGYGAGILALLDTAQASAA